MPDHVDEHHFASKLFLFRFVFVPRPRCETVVTAEDVTGVLVVRIGDSHNCLVKWLTYRHSFRELRVYEDGFYLERYEDGEDGEIRNAICGYYAVVYESPVEKEESKNDGGYSRANEREGADRRVLRGGKRFEIPVCFHKEIPENSEECLNGGEDYGNREKRRLVYRASYHGMERVFVPDERDSKEREVGDDDPDARGIFHGKPFLERGFVSDYELGGEEERGNGKERHRSDERNARGGRYVGHRGRSGEAYAHHGEREGRKELREVVIRVRIEVSCAKKPAEIPNEHANGNGSDNYEARYGERKHIFNDRPKARNHGNREREYYVHRHSKGERNRHELHLRIARKELGMGFGFPVGEIRLEVFKKEDEVRDSEEREPEVSR